jgi:hypothetical protein
MRTSLAVVAVLSLGLSLGLTACKTLSEVSIGYADAITTSQLPSEGPWTQVSVAFPSLAGMDPLSSPSLSRYAVTASEIESVHVTGVALEGDADACGLPFTRVEVQLVAGELGPATLATAERKGECLSWDLAADTEFGPWFRQAEVSVVALVDGQPSEASAGESLALRISFMVDIKPKRID